MQPLRLLVLEDDRHLRLALGRTLRNNEVVLCETAERALVLLGDGLNVDAILCDVWMSPIDGVGFYHHLEQVRPDLTRRVVFMTGGAATTRIQSFLAEVGLPILEKPFVGAELEAAVAEVMSESLQSGEFETAPVVKTA